MSTATDKPNPRKEYLSEDKSAHFLDGKLWLRFVAMTKRHRLLTVTCLLLLLISEIFPLLQPRLLRDMIDGPILQGRMQDLWKPILLFIGLVLGAGIFEYLKAVLSQNLGLRIIHELRLQIFARVQLYSMDFFHRTPIGRLMTRLGNDIDSLNSLFTEGLIDLLGAVLIIVYAVVFMLILDWRLALATLAVLPLMIWTTSIFRKAVRKTNVEIRQRLAELNSILQESLMGIPIVQIFGKAKEQTERFDHNNAACRDVWYKNVQCYAVFFPVIFGLTEMSLVLLYFVGAYLCFHHEVSLGTLVAFSWYAGTFFRPLRELSDKITALQTALAAGARVFTLYDAEVFLPTGNLEKVAEPVQIQFKNVNFGYEKDQPVLKDISFEVKAGETIALVGATGSGKSSIVSLCNKFYLQDSGEILLSGQPLTAYSEATLRRTIGLISQDVYLFSESIYFNIALGPDYDKQRVEEVCAQVQIHTFIQTLKNGYETKLQKGGENISAGQRQLLAFARALYHRPKILLLDEATASVDTQTEGLIQTVLADITKQMTTIAVAHRLSTIQKANCILVLHKGEIREQGTHDQLIEKQGIYYKLHKLEGFTDQH